MSPDARGVCWACGAALEAVDYAREGLCPQCRKPTHVCRNCRFFAPGRAQDCAEPIAEAVADKTRSNFCDYFEPTTDAFKPGEDPDRLRAAAEKLFDL